MEEPALPSQWAPRGNSPGLRLRRVVIGACVLLLIGLALAMLRLAWLSDDAFITFRTVENCVGGRGLCWNPGERVQAFTHPLWCLLLLPLRLCCGALPTATMLASVVLSLTAVVLLVRVLGAAPGLALIGVLLGSRAWLDFTTSGLETPLSYLCIALLVTAWQQPAGERRLVCVALATGLAALTRLDLLTLFGPVCLFACRGVSPLRVMRSLLLGAAPLAAWLLFAVIYYGTPFPVTAFAKAFCHGLPQSELLRRGGDFLIANGQHDPVATLLLVLGVAFGLLRAQYRWLAAGVLIYLLYCVSVGGDYMLGRFVAPPVLLAAFVVVHALHAAGSRWLIALLAVIAVVTASAARPGWTRSVQRDVEVTFQRDASDFSDERRFYYGITGLWSPHRMHLQSGAIAAARRAAGDGERKVLVAGMVGMLGYVEGELTHIVDPWLTDPLLMRLPVGDRGVWRVGHYYRRIPEGYLCSVAGTGTTVADSRLRAMHEAVLRVVSGPVFGAERWHSIWQLWTGAFDEDLQAYVADCYYAPPRRDVSMADLLAPPSTGGTWTGVQWWKAPKACSCAGGGVSVTLPAPRSVACLGLWLIGGSSRYHIELRCADATVFATTHEVGGSQLAGFQHVEIEVPAVVGVVDRIWLTSRAEVAFPEAPFVGGIELRPQ